MEVNMIKRLVVAVFILVALSACASTQYVVSDVTRFHTMSGQPSGQSFAIVAADDEQRQSLAFKQYASQLNTRLSALGLQQYSGLNGPVEADYVVTLKYSVAGPSPDVEGRRGSFSMSFGYGHYGRPFGYGAMLDPTYNDRTDTTQLFVRRVELDIYKGGDYGTDKQERIFEGRAVSQGRNGHVEAIMPFILDAILRDFPGVSGRTLTISIEIPPEAALSVETSSRPSSRSRY
ncbi:MAG TPA: hypothetical protein DGZ24_00230 [Rhodospirillaceae bacterium]|nr:hypothetical protein [Candidatus Neomarinimicrobiota bacterium]HCX13721.1 hypothetical protein [Rhodospirillaceae bacterium]|tara:strand:- start:238 stop:936 length:699 start_codon:yes stop_codon:yes gene_type:complete